MNQNRIPLEGVVEGVVFHSRDSDTAANSTHRKFATTGTIAYDVLVQTGMGGRATARVEAASGDDAAAKALEQYPGAKVAHVEPAPRGIMGGA